MTRVREFTEADRPALLDLLKIHGPTNVPTLAKLRGVNLNAVRQQLSAPGWSQLAQVRKRNKAQEVDIYVALTEDQAKGFAIVASEPRKFTIVNIVGSIDLEQIAKLQHHMDLHVDLDDALDADAIDIDP